MDTPVKVSPHRSLNQCRGIIKSAELDHVSEDELLSEIRNQHATNVKRIYVTRDGMKKPTNTWEVTFATPSAPSRLKAGYLSLAVFPYIPNPLRCFKCQLFGHHQGFCSRDPVCSKCGLKDHEDKNCTQTPSCVNCEGAHPAYSKECPKWIEEREICRVKATTNVSFKEARKLVLDKKIHPLRVRAMQLQLDPPSNQLTAVHANVAQHNNPISLPLTLPKMLHQLLHLLLNQLISRKINLMTNKVAPQNLVANNNLLTYQNKQPRMQIPNLKQISLLQGLNPPNPPNPTNPPKSNLLKHLGTRYLFQQGTNSHP